MPYTLGAAISDRFSFTSPSTFMSGANRCVMTWGWYLPTTLTATRRIWGCGAVTGVEIDTTTTQLRLKTDHATTDGIWTTTDAGLVVDKWSFLATMLTHTSGSTVAWRAWGGSVDTPPQELTVTNSTGPSGNIQSAASIIFGNDSGLDSAFQGDIAEVGYVLAGVTADKSPFFLAAAGAITNDEADYAYRRLVLPAYEGREFPRSAFADGALIERYSLVTGEGALAMVGTTDNTTTGMSTIPNVTGATVSANGHPKARVNATMMPQYMR